MYMYMYMYIYIYMYMPHTVSANDSEYKHTIVPANF